MSCEAAFRLSNQGPLMPVYLPQDVKQVAEMHDSLYKLREVRAKRRMRIFGIISLGLATALATGCGMAPVKQSEAHLRAEAPRSEGEIPPPVQVAPPLPKPRPTIRPETYSVVVNNVRVDDLLFALARDAKVNIDIHPGVTGTVTVNAIDQTLPQLLNRIAKQADMRYEFDGQILTVMRDTPYSRTYKIDYVSASRNVKMQATTSSQFASGGTSGGASTGTGTGSTATVDVFSTNQLWESIVLNVRDMLREAALPGAARSAPGAAPAAPQQPAAAPAVPPAPAAQPSSSSQAAQSGASLQDAAAVIGNREGGILFVRATSRQHERVQEFLDQVLASVKRQVLIEATIVEVQLNNQYQRGIDWQRLRSAATGIGLPAFGAGNSGFEFGQSSAGTPAAVDTNAFILGAANRGLNLSAAIRLLESFGDVKVLSSPKISVLNNQTALLRVTRDIVYFTITPSATPVTVAGGSGNLTIPQAFTTTPNVAAEGIMMSVLPQINEADTIVLNVRPTIRRRVAFATDPNPALSAGTPNLIPVFETRELDSILRLQSGQTAVLGGLMQDSASNTEDGIPGVSQIPGIGALFQQRKDLNTKTELVIFLRSTVIRDASMDGDYREFRNLLPGEDFLRRPNPGKPDPAAGEAAKR